MTNSEAMRGLPAVHRFLSDPQVAAFEALFGRAQVKDAIARVLDNARGSLRDGVPPFGTLRDAVLADLERAQLDALVPVVNGTGVLLHTNLGRAPLAPSAIEAIRDCGEGYSNLEYDVYEGRRGSRYDRAGALLRSVTGAQDALLVNNCAAAVLLILDTFAKGREVVVARSELVEIGGGFRLPDVLERSGARLVEVGATNKVYLHDFERALAPDTALLLRSHTSNYRITGFTHDVAGADLCALGKRAGVPVVEDLGSGSLVDLAEYGLPHERTVQEALSEGMDLIAFSGDKLLGGPQAGIIAGSKPLIARLRANPLLRALRVDKLTLAALVATLRLYAVPERRTEIPFYAMLAATPAQLRERAERYCVSVVGCEIAETSAYVGGGALPEHGIPSIGVALPGDAERVAADLRRGAQPIVSRIENGRALLDLRSILPQQDAQVITALQSIFA